VKYSPLVLSLALAGLLIRPSAQAQEAVVVASTDPDSPEALLVNDPAHDDVLNLDGRWAQLLVTTTVSRIPMLGEVRSVTAALLLMEIDQSGQNLSIHRQLCALDVDSGTSVVRTEVPDAFVDAIRDTTESATLVHTTRGPSLNGWRAQELVGLTGVNFTEPLPTDFSDTRYVDSDGDGNPGLTIRVRGLVSGEVYVASRGITELRPTSMTGELMSGEVDWTAEQVVLGASNRFLRGDGADPDPEPGYRGNYFRARRVAADSTCGSIVNSSFSLVGFTF
jgi:hypothetical protein